MAKEANKSTIIALLVVAGVLLFLIGSYVGNTVSVSRQTVYTKTEVDKLLAKYTTNQNVLNMLNKNCIVVDTGDICSNACAFYKKVCIFGHLNRDSESIKLGFAPSRPLPCGEYFNTGGNDAKISCVCCNP